MIQELIVRNISLIPELQLEPDAQLSVLSGETGAGKSILLGALSLLLGERASVDMIRTQCESASVEALFDISLVPRLAGLLEENGLPACEENNLILKRTLSRNGKGKCLVNGGYTTVTVLQRIGEELVDLHGQHEHQSLLHRSRQRDLLDAWAGLIPAREQLTGVYEQLRQSREARERLTMDEAQRARQLDVLNFQIDEIDAAQIKPGEGDQLVEEKSRLAHAERMLSNVHQTLEILHRREEFAVRDGLDASADLLTALSGYDANMGTLSDQLRSAEAMVADVVEQLSDFVGSFEADPTRLEAVEERLDLLHRLQKKYGGSESAILEFRDKATRERDGLAHQDETLEQLAQAEAELAKSLASQAQHLSDTRTKAGEKLARLLEGELKALGFTQAVFCIQVAPREDAEGWIAWEGKTYRCGPQGADEVEFLISPNPGEEPKPVSKIASGGELSRIMLAIKVIAAKASQVPTMIFDEVDAGIGGATAEAVGRKLKEISRHRQVLVITHLPQIARFASRHFMVQKSVEHGRTATLLTQLDPEQRVRELARMMAGDQISDTALQHARELIENQ